MKRYTILLLILLCACATQNLDPESINADETIELKSQTDHDNYIEVEQPIQQPNSVTEETDDKKNFTPETDKSIEKKDEITYGSVRNKDTTISFKTLPSVSDSSKEQGNSGYITKGSNGLQRKEIRDVYINGKFSHTETVKETYIVLNAIDEQKWFGTKEPSAIEEELEEINYIFYKTYDSFDTCNYQANELARINSKKGWLSTMCDGPNLYYTLRD